MMSSGGSDTDFERFAAEIRPRLIRAFVGNRGIDEAGDAAAEALAYAFEHWDRVCGMQNPGGYLYRVGQSRTRKRRPALLPSPEPLGIPEVEPALIPSLMALPQTQRTAVWLVHACGFKYSEAAEAMDTSLSMIGNHVSRALLALRRDLEVDDNA